LADVLETIVLANSIKCVLHFAHTGLLEGVLDARDNSLITISIINNLVTLLSANQLLDECLASARDRNNWMNI
jgi:hypothetical protein